MNIKTPTPPPPSNEFFKQIEQLQKSFSSQENKIVIDENKNYKKQKEKKEKKNSMKNKR